MVSRQDQLLQRSNRSNATAASRFAVPMVASLGDDRSDIFNDTASAASVLSHAPSLHPSVAGSVMSIGCSVNTIGAGDETGYWDYCHRNVLKNDLGNKCRECKQPFRSLGEPITERRGARISQRYHAECFSGFADPRSQASSSHNVGRHSGSHFVAAPQFKATSKMRSGSHFDTVSSKAVRSQRSSLKPKLGDNIRPRQSSKMLMGSNGFGQRSAKGSGVAINTASGISGAAGPGVLTASVLAAHTRAMEQVPVAEVEDNEPL